MNSTFEIAKYYESELMQFLRELIAIPSFCGKEGNVIQRLKLEMEKIGYDEIIIDGLGNLLGRIGNGPRVLAIDGHCDTVEVGNPDLWHVDPLGAEIKNGFIYGRGATDQKGGLASAVYSGKILKEIGAPNDVTLWIVASIMEEDCEGLPWKFIIEEEIIKPDAVLLTEPSNLTIARGQRGRLEMKVKTSGVSCHGSAPERGVNAIYKMAPIIQEVEILNSKLKRDTFLGGGSVTISNIQSTAPSLCAVADSCTIHLDRRLTIGETINTSLTEVKSLHSFKQSEVWIPEYKNLSYKGRLFPMKSYFPTWTLKANHPLVKSAIKSFSEVFNSDPIIDKWVFSTNGVATMGLFNIPTIGFGPGEEKLAHAPNECIPIDHLAKAMAFYAEFVKNF